MENNSYFFKERSKENNLNPNVIKLFLKLELFKKLQKENLSIDVYIKKLHQINCL